MVNQPCVKYGQIKSLTTRLFPAQPLFVCEVYKKEGKTAFMSFAYGLTGVSKSSVAIVDFKSLTPSSF